MDKAEKAFLALHVSCTVPGVSYTARKPSDKSRMVDQRERRMRAIDRCVWKTCFSSAEKLSIWLLSMPLNL